MLHPTKLDQATIDLLFPVELSLEDEADLESVKEWADCDGLVDDSWVEYLK